MNVPTAIHRFRAGARRAIRGPLVAVVAVAALAVLAGCRIEMFDQPRMKPLRGSEMFADSQSARPQIAGTVPRNPVWSNGISTFAEATGGRVTGSGINAPHDTLTNYADRLALDGDAVDKNGPIPFPVTKELVERGHQRFDIFCSPCHGRMGDGKGMVVERGFPQPPSYHIDRLRNMPDGYFYDVITNGYARMYSYASRIVPEDRWAIVSYVRALQLSQHATIEDVPAQERTRITGQ